MLHYVSALTAVLCAFAVAQTSSADNAEIQSPGNLPDILDAEVWQNEASRELLGTTCQDLKGNQPFVMNGKRYTCKRLKRELPNLYEGDFTENRFERQKICRQKATRQEEMATSPTAVDPPLVKTSKPVKTLCPATCGLCRPCLDIENQKFELDGRLRKCSYVRKQSRKDQRKLCRTVVKTTGNNDKVRSKRLWVECPATCGKVGIGRCSESIQNP